MKGPLKGVFFFKYLRKIMSLFVIVILALIFGFLGSAVIGLLRGGKEGSDRMFKALRMRIILSVLLFAFLLFAGYVGWIEPNGFNLLPTQ